MCVHMGISREGITVRPSEQCVCALHVQDHDLLNKEGQIDRDGNRGREMDVGGARKDRKSCFPCFISIVFFNPMSL